MAAAVEVAFGLVRRVVVFGLGVWVIANALLNPEERVSQLIVGMVMVGVLPVDNILDRFRRPATPATTPPDTPRLTESDETLPDA